MHKQIWHTCVTFETSHEHLVPILLPNTLMMDSWANIAIFGHEVSIDL
ncbi:hypothetical protein [Anaplasma bovis]